MKGVQCGKQCVDRRGKSLRHGIGRYGHGLRQTVVQGESAHILGGFRGVVEPDRARVPLQGLQLRIAQRDLHGFPQLCRERGLHGVSARIGNGDGVSAAVAHCRNFGRACTEIQDHGILRRHDLHTCADGGGNRFADKAHLSRARVLCRARQNALLLPCQPVGDGEDEACTRHPRLLHAVAKDLAQCHVLCRKIFQHRVYDIGVSGRPICQTAGSPTDGAHVARVTIKRHCGRLSKHNALIQANPNLTAAQINAHHFLHCVPSFRRSVRAATRRRAPPFFRDVDRAASKKHVPTVAVGYKNRV